MRKRKKRIYAMLLCICMVLSLISAPVSAAETGEAAGSHEHTSECYHGRNNVPMSIRRSATRRTAYRGMKPHHPRQRKLPGVPMYAARKAAVSQKN